MGKKRKKSVKAVNLVANPDPYVVPNGTICVKHSAVHSYVDDKNQHRCRQCDEEADKEEVDRVVRKIQAERELEKLKADAPFSFITAEKLKTIVGFAPAEEQVRIIRSWEKIRKEWYRKHTKAPCTEPCRWHLPDERKSLTHHFEIGDENIDGVSAYIHAGMYEDWRLGEVFIRAAKMGGYVSGFTDAFATSLSIMLQHGVPLKLLADKFSYQSFDPHGFVRGGPAELKTCKSVLDYVVRWLALRFPDGYLDPKHRDEAVTSRS